MKKVRFEMQMTDEQKRLLKLAANYAGFNTLSAFILKTCIDESKKVIKRNN
jgi:uncharacterized protein (DUF1778 family)